MTIEGQRGRKRDASRDGAILMAATEVLGEVGFERMTMDMVAARIGAGKATLYRRWPSKEALVLDVIDKLRHKQVDLENVPDTGSLRGDLLAMFEPATVAETERKLRGLSGVATLLTFDRELSDAAAEALAGPWIAANLIVMKRAIARGEIAPHLPIETLATVIPSIGVFRALVQREPFDQAFLETMVDVVLLPAMGVPVGP